MHLAAILHFPQLTELGYDTGEIIEPNHRMSKKPPWGDYLGIFVYKFRCIFTLNKSLQIWIPERVNLVCKTQEKKLLAEQLCFIIWLVIYYSVTSLKLDIFLSFPLKLCLFDYSILKGTKILEKALLCMQKHFFFLAATSISCIQIFHTFFAGVCSKLQKRLSRTSWNHLIQPLCSRQDQLQ